MKYWKDSEIQYITCGEGERMTPYKHPASKVTKILPSGETILVEIEIIPNTSEIREYINYNTFEAEHDLCVKVERRRIREGVLHYEEQFWIPLSHLGYKKEPYNSKTFDEAMKII